MKKTILFLCLCYLVGVTYAQEPFRVMFYNVENLFVVKVTILELSMRRILMILVELLVVADAMIK